MSRRKVDTVNKKSATDPQSCFESIHAIMHLFRSEQYRVLRDGPHELTHLEGRLLGFFARRPGATLSDLAEHFGRDKGQLARLIKTLKDQGLLLAATDETDRRSVRLSLSAEALAIHKTLQRQVGVLSHVALQGLTDPERLQLQSLLDRVKANLEGTGPT